MQLPPLTIPSASFHSLIHFSRLSNAHIVQWKKQNGMQCKTGQCARPHAGNCHSPSFRSEARNLLFAMKLRIGSRRMTGSPLSFDLSDF